MNRNKAKYMLALLIGFFGCVLGLGAVRLVSRTKSYSEAENRSLKGRPQATISSVSSGRYMTNYEDYVEDQFPLRDVWLEIRTLTDRIMGKTESNGVFLGKHGYLIQDFTEPDETDWEETVNAVREFAERHTELSQTALVAPTAVSVLADYLPQKGVAGNEEAYIEHLSGDLEDSGITFVDVRGALSQAAGSNQVYYRTDHHWTTDGAYAAYLCLAEKLSLSGGSEKYETLPLTDSFQGTLSAASGYRTGECDVIRMYQPETAVNCRITYVEEGETSYSFYDTEQLSVRDQYAVFMGGNHPLVKIETSGDSSRVLLLLKDSYANCFVPFLACDYRKILMVDPRYYSGDLESLIQSEGVTDVLYLYNIQTFAEDEDLKTVLDID